MFGWFKKIGSFVKKAIGVVETKVSDAILEEAVSWVRVARETFTDNAKRREFVVSMLVKNGKVPESMARLIVELAVRLVKDEEV